MNNFSSNMNFSQRHMNAVKEAIGSLPINKLIRIEDATTAKDMNEATDLELKLAGGDMAVRVRSKQYWERGLEEGFDWSVRAVVRTPGRQTEIDKLKAGFGKWYFYGYSFDDKGTLAYWWLIDLDRVRAKNILDRPYPIIPNGDGSKGKYIPIKDLHIIGAVQHAHTPKVRRLPPWVAGGWELLHG